MLQLVPIFCHSLHHSAFGWPNNGFFLSSLLEGRFIFLFSFMALPPLFLLSPHFQTPRSAELTTLQIYVGFSVFTFFVMKILSTPSWPGFDKICVSYLRAPICHHQLSECSSECWCPKINCCFLSHWKCTRHWHQTQPSASQILLSTLPLFRFTRTLLLITFKKTNK